VKYPTWQNPEQHIVAQELINFVKLMWCGIKEYQIIFIRLRLLDMKLFVVRLLYSLYCAECWTYRMPMRKLGPMLDRLAKRLYFWDPFGFIQKNNPTLEHYIRNIHKTMDIVFYDKNLGVSIIVLPFIRQRLTLI
jgi:hypothetical protein